MPKKKDSAGGKPKVCDWITMGLSRLERTPHVRHCLFCKELLDMCAVAEDDYVESAKKVIAEHIEADPNPVGRGCRYSGCVFHERMKKKLALAILRVGKGDKPWSDIRGIKVGTAPLRITEDDHPEGYDMKAQDIQRRAFEYLDDSAGDIYVRLGPKVTTVHVWIALSYPTRHETLDDPATIADVKRQFEESYEPVREWCMAKYRDLKSLAEMDLEFEEE